MTTAQSFWTDTDSVVKTPMMEQLLHFCMSKTRLFRQLPFQWKPNRLPLLSSCLKKEFFLACHLLMTSIRSKRPLRTLMQQKSKSDFLNLSLKERFDLNQILSQLGISTAFTPKANFSGIDGKMDLYLSKVYMRLTLPLMKAALSQQRPPELL